MRSPAGFAGLARRINHVVDEDADLPLGVADDVHHFGHVRDFSTRVDDREVGAKSLREGARALEDLRRSLNELSDPSRPLAHGAMILVAGVLLLTPGFFTDALGLLLLIPGVRNWVMTRLASRVTVARFEMGGGPFPPGGADRRRPHDPDVIDAEEIDEITPRTPPRDGPSGWTRH